MGDGWWVVGDGLGCDCYLPCGGDCQSLSLLASGTHFDPMAKAVVTFVYLHFQFISINVGAMKRTHFQTLDTHANSGDTHTHTHTLNLKSLNMNIEGLFSLFAFCFLPFLLAATTHNQIDTRFKWAPFVIDRRHISHCHCVCV